VLQQQPAQPENRPTPAIPPVSAKSQIPAPFAVFDNPDLASAASLPQLERPRPQVIKLPIPAAAPAGEPPSPPDSRPTHGAIVSQGDTGTEPERLPRPLETGDSAGGVAEQPAVAVPQPAVDLQAESLPAKDTEGLPADTSPSAPLVSPLTDLQDSLLAALAANGLRDRLEVRVHRGVVSLEISDSILFQPASAGLTADGAGLLDELAVAFAEQPYSLSVEGHTDNVPIQTARFPSNWELSSARAAMVTRRLIERGMAADRVRAIGYGDTRPRADNGTPEGRASNRRVSFVLQASSPEPSGAVD
jgi:chemotaxis protein MotB